jgi:pre-mRNA-splicing helicase BRR2
MNVLDLESEQLFYRPKTKETQLIYEDFLTMMLHYLPDQSQSTLKGALDAVLGFLKTDELKDSQKKEEIEAVLGRVTPEEFNRMYQLSKGLVDYGAELKDRDYTGENIIEVPVEFEEVNYEEDEESEVEEENINQQQLELDEEEKRIGLNQEYQSQERKKISPIIEEIFNNPYWLQNSIREVLNFDDTMVLPLEKEILGILTSKEKRECENKLVLLLKQENFSFIKILLENRFAVYFLTRLGKAQSDQEREKILDEMSENTDGRKVLSMIEDIKSSTGSRKINKDKENLLSEVTKKSRELHVTDQKMTDNMMTKISRNQIDLEALKFTTGSHFMSNQKVLLPKGVQKITKKGYEEVYIPAADTSKVKDEKEIEIRSLPEWMHVAFMGRDLDGNFSFITEKFNKVQSKVLDSAINSDENILICAPTSSGKTNIALMTILRLISHYRNPNTGIINLKNFKVVYIAPMKALVKETVGNFTQRLKEFNMQVRELSGDVNLTKKEIENTHVIVTTPEKWDIITRKSGEKTFTELVKLVILDEIHLLHDTRGAVLESIISRTIRKIETTTEKIRIVGLSATLPNYEDVAAFLRVDNKKGLFYFDSSYRPVPLEQIYIGVTEKKSIKKMLLMNEITYEKVIERAGKKQIIIFVHSRRETVRTAKAIKEMALARDELNKFLSTESKANEFKAILNEDLPNIRDANLKELLQYGIGVHHAGMDRNDREVVEDYFNNGYLQLIVSTATLAWGVNLPAHTVIIKGTQVYDPERGGWVELSPLDVLQMMGRAGRFGYGSPKGEGIIITSHYELQFYLSLLNQQLPIESQMISALADNLNAEIVLGTITNLKDAVNWLSYTYLYIRMLKNPILYGVTDEEKSKDPYLLQRRSDLIHTAANILDKHGLIKYDRKTGYFQMTQLGRVSSHYYIKYQSMAIYNENLKPTISQIDLFRLFSLSSEFKQIPIREEEKKEVEKLMLKVPIPIKGAIEEPATKVNVLLQAYISQFKLEGYAIGSDMVYIAQSAGRIMRALYEISVKRSWANLALLCLNVSKEIDKRMWSTMTPLRQFKVIPEEILYKIERKEQLTWDRFYDLTATQISELVKINKKQGEGVHKLVHTFPRLELVANIQPLTRSHILVELIITPDFKWNNNYHGTSETFHVFVEDNDSEIVLHYETFILKAKYAEEDHRLSFIVPMIEPVPPQYFIRVVSDRWINCEKLLAISFKHTILPEKFPPATKLLDLQPLLFSALRYPEAEKMYREEFKYEQMYPIQTQTFKSLYESNESILVGAPTGSGKTLCGDFAILKYLKEMNINKGKFRAPVIYVSSIESLVKDKFREFSHKFGDILGYKVEMLTGQLTLDNKIFDNSHIVLSTPDKLDMLTRRWRRKQTVQEISLVIVDEVHLLGESGGILEVVLSRLRYMSYQLEKEIRFIALGTSLANPINLSEWLGITSNNIYNFNPNVRPNKLEIYIQGYDQTSRKMRLMAMSRPLYTSIKTHGSKGRDKYPCMIYVSDRQQARITALDLLTHAAVDDNPKKFLLVDFAEEYADLLEEIDEPTLKHTIKFGVGYLHESLTEREKQIIIQLYQSKLIQVLVVTHSLCWEININCHLVVLLDPVKYDGKEHAWIDYSVPDMLQIMGRATISSNSQCKFVLFCQSSKKEFYKKFLSESFPLESHLNHFLHDHITAEVVSGTIQNKQDCLDWLTWTYMYRRLLQNPNYYDMKGKTNVHLNDYLSELVENTILDLVKANCISSDDKSGEVKPMNFGRVAVFYYVKYNTIDLFSQSLTEESKKMRDLLLILKSAYEFEDIPIRKGDEILLRDLADQIVYKVEDVNLLDPHMKSYILLQCYFSRLPIPSDLLPDQRTIVDLSQRLVLAMVDVLSTNGLLRHALLAMELSQMIVQAMWISQSPLLQLPHFDIDLVRKCSQYKVEDLSDLMNMEDEDRNKLLKFNELQLSDVARVCNRYPSIEMTVNLKRPGDDEDQTNGTKVFTPQENFEINIQLNRDYDLPTLTPVPSLYYPNEKEEAWWLIVGESNTNVLRSIKRFTFVKEFKLNFTLPAPENPGDYVYNVFLLSDSWIGCDQEEKVEVSVKEN